MQQPANRRSTRSEDRVRIAFEPVPRPGGGLDREMATPTARIPGQRPATSPMVRPEAQQRVEVTSAMESARERTPAEWIDAYILREEVHRLPVSIVIATLNDAPTIAHVVSQLAAVQQLVVVDSGSTDGTLDLVREERDDAVVISHRHTGPGSAVLAGIAATSGRYVVCVAADDDLDVAEIHRAIAMVDGGSGIVAGTRRQVLDEPRGPKPPFGGQGRALAGFCNLLLGTKLADPPFGYVAMSRAKAAELGLGPAVEPIARPLVPHLDADPDGDRRRAESRWLGSQ